MQVGGGGEVDVKGVISYYLDNLVIWDIGHFGDRT